MAGIYIHIPYCKQACHYCNFHFSTSIKNKGRLLDALAKEIAMRKDYLAGERVNTVYFGGGTPSLLSSAELDKIMELLQRHYVISPDSEVTLEANPDDILKKGYLSSLKQAGINRLSIGVQSFSDKDLCYMNRAHCGMDALHAIEKSQSAGFENISIDLIYGTPTLSNQQWKKNMQVVCDLGIPHISAYLLTVEQKTALDRMIFKGKCDGVDDKVGAAHFELLMEVLSSRGYIHYEISNFCLPGHIAKHNSNYWKGEKYMGLGPSAHSYNGGKRQWNLSHNYKYISAIGSNGSHFQGEELSILDQFNEYIMTSLRTIWGVDTDHIEKTFGKHVLEAFSNGCVKHIDQGRLEKNGKKVFVTGKGKLLTDSITSDLFQVEENMEKYI